MRISDWSSDVCSSDLLSGPVDPVLGQRALEQLRAAVGTYHPRMVVPLVEVEALLARHRRVEVLIGIPVDPLRWRCPGIEEAVDMPRLVPAPRSEEHTSELQPLMRRSYAVFCLKKIKQTKS